MWESIYVRDPDEEVEEEEEGAYFATAIYWELWRDHDLEPGIEVGYKKGGWQFYTVDDLYLVSKFSLY